jgi:hypothetical protein
LNNEYLFFAVALEIVATTGSGTTRDANWRQNTNSKVVTPVFTPKEPDGTLHVAFQTPARDLEIGGGLQAFIVRARKKGTGTHPTYTIKVYENGVHLASTTDITLSAADPGFVNNRLWNASLLSGISGSLVEMVVQTNNTPGASVEIGAVEWEATIIDAALELTRNAVTWLTGIETGSNRTLESHRTSTSWLKKATSQAGRYLNSVRVVTSSVARIVGVAQRVQQKFRAARTYLTADSYSNRTTQLFKTALSHLTADSTAIRIVERYRTVRSHMTSIVESYRDLRSVRRVESWSGRIWTRASSSTAIELVRSAVSWMVRGQGSATRTLESFRFIRGFLSRVRTLANRLTRLFRDVESSGGGFGSSATVKKSLHRTARSHATADAHASGRVLVWFPYVEPVLVVEVLPKSKAELLVVSKRKAEVMTQDGITAEVMVDPKVRAEVTVDKKRGAEIGSI